MNAADTIVIVDPAVEDAATEATPARRLASVAGAHIGMIDNSKHMARELLLALEQLLRQRYAVGKFTHYRKFNPSVPTPPAILANLIASCDGVVHGVAD